jgi:ESF2/ABP1 family protein
MSPADSEPASRTENLDQSPTNTLGTFSNAASDTSKSLNENQQRKRPASVAGIVHVRRIPPGLSVAELRRILERYGRIGRVYLRKEQESERRERIMRGGSRRRMALEAWVEFLDPQRAEQVAALLNATPMDPQRRRSRFHGDLWCIEYIRDLQWHHLSDQMAAMRRERILRIKNEVHASRRERDHWLERLREAHVDAAIQQKRQKRLQRNPGDHQAKSNESRERRMPPQHRPRVQRDIAPTERGVEASSTSPADCEPCLSSKEPTVERILRQIANPTYT